VRVRYCGAAIAPLRRITSADFFFFSSKSLCNQRLPDLVRVWHATCYVKHRMHSKCINNQVVAVRHQ
jgi:hypothetical protein